MLQKNENRQQAIKVVHTNTKRDDCYGKGNKMVQHKWGCALFVLGTALFCGYVEARTFQIPKDFSTIQEAVDSDRVSAGDRLIIRKGRHEGAVITKPLRIVGSWGAIIDSGPILMSNHPCVGNLEIGFRIGQDGPVDVSGTTISNLIFDNLEFPVFSQNVDTISVTGNLMVNSIQAITNRGGSDWRISYNLIHNLRTANGGGIGIFITDRYARAGGVAHNFVTYNNIGGTVYVSECDSGGYSGGGIFLQADFRNGAAGAEYINENLVSWNRIDLISDTPNVVDVVGIVVEDSRNDETINPVLTDNAIMYNDLHHLENPLLFAPESLAEVNFVNMNWM